MHRCLSIQEVIRLICNQLGGSPRGRAALGHLAVTCRSFLDPSLDSLWRQQSSLRPLLGCLPNFWEDTPSGFVRHTNSTCLATATDWDRVFFYARRIKKFTAFGYTTSEGISWEILAFISTSLPADLLLPNVEHLSWSPRYTDRESSVPYLRLFLGPKLTRIVLQLDGSATCLSLLPRIAAKCPALTDIRVSYMGSLDATREHRARAASAMIRSLTDIQTIAIGGIDTAGCQHLATMPNLTSLCIDMFDEPLFDNLQPPPHPMFASLETLDIHASEIDFLTNFIISGISDASLDTLYVSAELPALEDQSRGLFTAIKKYCSPEFLASINVNLGDCTGDVLANPDAYTVLPATLAPLLDFVNLVKVTLSVPFGLVLNDAFVVGMAEAWPYIKELFLSRPYMMNEPTPPSEVTISALSSFASHCPDLRSLGIPLSANLPASSGVPRITQATLTTLYVFDSPINIGTPFVVAAFLSATFPGLSYISTSREGYFLSPEHDPAPQDAEPHKRWKEVEKLLPLLVAVRKEDERHWREQLG
ncbi:hypothetical protein FB451DRAFT_1083577 [Mycena latifolia]|nr:hypothetical protein FB451DRAFT_1083577 [Mycena latifolia]